MVQIDDPIRSFIIQPFNSNQNVTESNLLKGVVRKDLTQIKIKNKFEKIINKEVIFYFTKQEKTYNEFI